MRLRQVSRLHRWPAEQISARDAPDHMLLLFGLGSLFQPPLPIRRIELHGRQQGEPPGAKFMLDESQPHRFIDKVLVRPRRSRGPSRPQGRPFRRLWGGALAGADLLAELSQGARRLQPFPPGRDLVASPLQVPSCVAPPPLQPSDALREEIKLGDEAARKLPVREARRDHDCSPPLQRDEAPTLGLALEDPEVLDHLGVAHLEERVERLLRWILGGQLRHPQHLP
mmetsp:Transcript_81906/g.228259  ORF Transcript_81906/g.228259 Transcript_81906/m.228259 type:complete len:226 (+) Transcript_81906:497-1174(+)